jgi:carnitine O-acetyltransferase
MSPKRSFKASSASKTETPPKGYAIDPYAGPMLRYQDSLPRLPVPTLSSTASKYLESVRPHLSDSAFLTTKTVVQSFLESPQASELQKRLQARAAEPEVKNWLADWWNDAAYLGYRDPVVVFVSYYFVHVDDKKRREPARRAASLIKALLPFRELTETWAYPNLIAEWLG